MARGDRRALGGRWTVYDIEYTAKGFEAACGAWRGRIAVVRRDLEVDARGTAGYVFDECRPVGMEHSG